MDRCAAEYGTTAHWIPPDKARYASVTMRILLLLIVLLLPTFIVAAEVYRWVDDDGEAHYSDRPQEGAEKITIQEAQTFSNPVPQSRSSSTAPGSTTAAEDEDTASYSNIEIVSPKQEEEQGPQPPPGMRRLAKQHHGV